MTVTRHANEDGVHPFAAAFPLMPEDEMESLAEDIKANGLQQPIVVDKAGLVLDGRNRLAACAQVGVEPETVVYGGDPIDFIISANVERRHLSTGQRAMARAMALSMQGKRKNGRWADGVVQDLERSRAWRVAMAQAGVVLDETPHAAPAVLAGITSLDAAYKTAKEVRDGHSTVEAHMIELREQAPDLATLVDGGADLEEQYAAWKQRKHERERALRRHKEWLESFLQGWRHAATLRDSPDRDAVLALLTDFDRERLLRIEKETTWPSTLI